MRHGKPFATSVDGDAFQRVARHVDAISEDVGGRVVCLVCVDDDGQLFVAPQPGSEKTVLRYLASIDWRAAQLTFAEFFVR